MTQSVTQLQSSERQAKFMSERLERIEETFGLLCDTLASINRKNAKLRDRGDSLAECVMTYADSETVNKSTKKALQKFATNFSAVQTFRDAKVKRTDDKVVQPLSEYGKKCKSAKRDVQMDFTSRKREIREYEQLQKLKSANPSNPVKINAAEDRLKKAKVDALHSTRTLEKNIESFEQQKVLDIKKVLSDFVHIEMVFHAKALENLSLCYESLNTIDPDDDLELFRNTLKDFGGNKTSDDAADENIRSAHEKVVAQAIYSEPMVITPRKEKESTLTREYRDTMYDDLDDDDDEDDLSDYDDDETTTAR